MIIKDKEGLDADITRLEELLRTVGLTARQRQLIHDEISHIRSGDKGEREAAYFIDFVLRDSKNYAVIHDLRIEHEGRVAQVDHLIMGRMAAVILVESKNISTSVRITDNAEFEVKTRDGWKGMASPVEQNIRHVAVIDGFLRKSGILPSRLGFQLTPTFHHWVLVPASCTLGKNRDWADIVKMDMFRARFAAWVDRKEPNEVIRMAKVVSSGTLRKIATQLASHHRPIEIDYRRKFRIVSSPTPERRTAIPARPTGVAVPARPGTFGKDHVCAQCREGLDRRVVQFCVDNPDRFRGRLLCRSCQRLAAERCDECAAEVDAKVVAFCRFNSQRLAERLLCRDCQRNISSVVTSDFSSIEIR